MFRPPASAAAENRVECRAITSSVLTPMDPVLPRIDIFFME